MQMGIVTVKVGLALSSRKKYCGWMKNLNGY